MLKTVNEVNKLGWHALVEKLGASGATMYILEHERGYGDYTKIRKRYFENKSIEDITSEIKHKKKNKIF